jgi:hypothetical protein
MFWQGRGSISDADVFTLLKLHKTHPKQQSELSPRGDNCHLRLTYKGLHHFKIKILTQKTTQN